MTTIPAPAAITAAQVNPGDRISVPGLITTEHSVEMVRRVPTDPGDPDLDMVEITVWPHSLTRPPFPQPRTEREHNFGHFYAQFMVTISVIANYPINRH